VTTSVSLSLGPVNVVATIAPPFTTGVEPSYSSSLPTSTATGEPTEDDNSVGRSQLGGIISAAVIGTLIAALLVVSGLLWNAKRKRAKERGVKIPDDDLGGDKNDSLPSTPGPQYSMAELGDGGTPATASTPAEMKGDLQMPAEMEADDKKKFYEMPASSTFAPVELPAELPAELLVQHAGGGPRCDSRVSAVTSHSTRSSLDRYEVSPTTMESRRTSLTKRR
jgi:hypothetical protein